MHIPRSLRGRLAAAGSAGVLAAALAVVPAVAQTHSPTQGQAQGTSTVLPVPEPAYQGTLGRTLATSSPPAYPPPVTASRGAPNVLLIMTDDVGFGASSTFGGPIPTPNYDALAAHGLRYNQFHTTALCSPTRAALLTGRNHHSVGYGVIAELATGYPGYDGIIPRSAATIGQVLRDNGYSTAWFGKNHNTPDWEITPNGPFDHWPNAMGFDYFYGFMGGETNQWAPTLVENRSTVEPPHDDPTYHLDRDLADHAISWLQVQRNLTPNKPFLMYIAPGTAHAPHDAPKEWVDRFKGKFDQGWDKLREETFARQKAAGIIPAGADLTPRPAEIPAWDSLSADQKKVYAREMEVYAAALAYCDEQLGRVIQSLKDSGQFDNTLILYIEGDNGASAEGGLNGTTDDLNALNGMQQQVPFLLTQLDKMGGPQTGNHYSIGWAWAMDTPFQWTKQVASHFGGTRNGLVVSWPERIKASGEVRSQFAHVVDVAATLYDAIGITPPKVVDGAEQKPLEGTSFAESFTAANAPDRHTTQYFEMFANRAIYKDGWVAATHPKRLPWIPTAGNIDPESYTWELYHVAVDYSEAHDLAAQEPRKLEELKAAFYEEAAKHNVLPIDARALERTLPGNRPTVLGKRTDFTYYAGPARYGPSAWPDLRNRSWTLKTTVEVKAGAQGMIATDGGRFGGWGLMLTAGKPTFIYRRTNEADQVTRVTGTAPLSPGKHEIVLAFAYDGGGFGRGGTATITVDGKPAAQGHVPATIPFWISTEGAMVGRDGGTPLTDDYKLPFAFQGRIERVDFNVPPLQPANAPPAHAAQAAAAAAD